jgi:hypothetical protein
MHHNKSTKGTHVYSNNDAGAAIPSVYIKKDNMTNPPPKTIEVTFVAVDD